MSVRSRSDQQRLRRALEAAIIAFEPRLKDPVVTIEPSRDGEQALRFRIDAHLRVEPAPEPVAFATVLELNSGKYQVKAA
jgi:type VI secretion system protein ImpF